jgi:hypothetical protein
MHNLNTDPAFMAAIGERTQLIVYSCMLMIPLFMLVRFLWSFGLSFFTSGNMMIDSGFLLRGIFVWLVVANYLEILDTVSYAIESFKNLIPTTDILSRLNDFIEKTPVPENQGEGMWDFVTNVWNFQTGAYYFVNSLIEQGLTMVIRIGYEKIQAILIGFLVVVGPISLMLSLIPGMDNLGSYWFKGWFVVNMWSVTLRVLDLIIVTYNESVYRSMMSGGETSILDSLIINLVIFFMYLLVPTLTSYFVGQSATNGFLGKLAGVVATTLFATSAKGKLMGGTSATSSAGSSADAGSKGTGPALSPSPSGGGGGGFGNWATMATSVPPGGGGNTGTVTSFPFSSGPQNGGSSGISVRKAPSLQPKPVYASMEQ